MNFPRVFARILPLSLLLAVSAGAFAQVPGKMLALYSQASTDPADAVCPRFPAGSQVTDPPELTSQNGILEVTFKFQTAVDAHGLTRYCYITDMGSQAPTLHVSPGDKLVIHFQNDLPSSQTAGIQVSDNACSAQSIDASSTNLHFPGLNIAPVCHQDEALHTAVSSQQSFDYTVQIPADEPPGLYWYHPQFSEDQVLGGASGAIIVDGIQNFNSSLAGLPERVFVLRDQKAASSTATSGTTSLQTDLSLNYVPVTYAANTPAVIQTAPSEQEFWRVLNASADTLLDLQVTINNVAQPFKVVAIDGVPLKNSDGSPTSETQTDYVLPPGARVEFVLTTPASSQQAQLVTKPWNNGASGDSDPGRIIASIQPTSAGTSAETSLAKQLPAAAAQQAVTRFAGLNSTSSTTQRKLYFSQNADASQDYLTVDGQTPAAFDRSAPPSITVPGGTVEQWTIENRSEADHAFHIDQTHFQVLAIDGRPVNDSSMRDTVNVPHWSGNTSDPYPSVKLLMDFRDPNIAGTFLYQDETLSHADRGMMGAVQVQAQAATPTTTKLTASPANAVLGQTVTFTATVTGYYPTVDPETVTFLDGTTVVGTATMDKSGVAVFKTKTLTLGTHWIHASYPGDKWFESSNSFAVEVQVTPATTTTTLTVSDDHPVLGQTIAFTATVTGFNSAVPSETVTFLDGTRVVGTATTNSSGVAVFKTKSFKLGTYWIHASYPGNTWFAASTSYAIKITVSPATTTTTLTTSATNIAPGQPVTFTASVIGFNSSVDPEPMTFYDGGKALGTATLSAPAADRTRTATYTTTALAAGTHSITASYPGNTWFAGSTSSAVTVTVGGAAAATGFTLTVNPATLTVVQGQSATADLTVTPQDGFNAPVSFSCEGLPEGAQCNFSPSTVTPDGTNAVSGKLTITTSQSTALLHPRSLPRTFYAFLLPGLGLLLGFAGRSKKLYTNGRLLCILFALLAITSCLTACGVTVNPNPPGISSNVTVTASASSGTTQLSHSANVTLTVKR